MSEPSIGGHASGVAVNSIRALGSVPIARRQRQVLAAISELFCDGRRPSDQDMSALLQWPINTITPRRGELARAGLIKKGGNKRGTTERRVAWWRPVPQQLDLFAGARRS